MMRVTRAGFASVQDLGRGPAAAAGLPRGGAFDEWSLRRGNRLCGNAPDAAGIEFVLAGPEVVFDDHVVVALTGAPFSATLGGTPLRRDEAVRVSAGVALSVGKAQAGARGYLCVAGGIGTEPVHGSRSASPRAGLGAMLAGGDRLPIGPPPAADASAPAPPERTGVVRVVAGPHTFAPGALEALTAAPWTVTLDADRVGVRLDGPALPHGTAGPEADPEPTIPGAIQVPGDGRPIVLGPDGPATGGYPKIATVIRADLWLVAQARPGDRLSFAVCDPPAARRALERRLSETDV